jgi:hypothetical protein
MAKPQDSKAKPASGSKAAIGLLCVLDIGAASYSRFIGSVCRDRAAVHAGDNLAV